MPKRIIYQTLGDTCNPNVIESHGPFKCIRSNAWLGHGYYFWESYVENAHWWGRHAYNNDYIICQAGYEYTEQNCLDLVDNPDHNILFRKSIQLMKIKDLFSKETTVARVIEFMRLSTNSFKNFNAIRAFGINSRSINLKPSLIVNFERHKPAYLDLLPTVQVCIINKESMKLHDFKVIHPIDYTEGLF